MSELKRAEESYLAEIEELRKAYEEERCDRLSAEREAEVYQRELENNEKKMEYMRGQIDAFKFCVACGKSRREKNE